LKLFENSFGISLAGRSEMLPGTWY